MTGVGRLLGRGARGGHLRRHGAGTGDPQPRHPLRELELAGFSAVHEDGTVGVRGRRPDRRPGPVGAGASGRSARASRRCCGRWPGSSTTPGRCAGTASRSPSRSCSCGPTRSATWRSCRGCCPARSPTTSGSGTRWTRPARSRPRSWSTTWPRPASGLGLLIGHKGTRLSGGQLQRLALARALAPRTELLIADDVSSALDVTTELDLWRALREHGVTVVGSTSKRAALAQADQVVVLIGGTAVAQRHLARAGRPLGPPGRLSPALPPEGSSGCPRGSRGWPRCGDLSSGRVAVPGSEPVRRTAGNRYRSEGDRFPMLRGRSSQPRSHRT